jgi:Fic family protein
VRFKPVSALTTPKFMDQIIKQFNHPLADENVDPLLLIATFVFDFECVHPFMDGNSRIGQLLTFLLFYQAGYEVGSHIRLERIVEDSKEIYYEALTRARKAGTSLVELLPRYAHGGVQGIRGTGGQHHVRTWSQAKDGSPRYRTSAAAFHHW